MTRHGRLSAARTTRWIEQYNGKDIVAGYAKWFAVDPPCAVIELRMLGVTIDAARENRIKATIEARTAERKRRQELQAKAQLEPVPPDSDETFAFVVGHTSAGAPYGITPEELGGEPPYFDDQDTETKQAVAPENGHHGGTFAPCVSRVTTSCKPESGQSHGFRYYGRGHRNRRVSSGTGRPFAGRRRETPA